MSIEIRHRHTGAVLLVIDSANLASADLCGAKLASADLCGANLCGAKLASADLCGAKLYSANLHGADLYSADLHSANMYGANMAYANLCGANMASANLRGASLRGANLNNETKFSPDTIMPAGYTWAAYLAEVVPALLRAGGRTVRQVLVGWDYRTWPNCPMALAFGVDDLDKIPALYRWEVAQFVRLFDAGLVPAPAPEPET